ncbi:hypothetical protein [Arsukibacterium indicum]|uniref:Uncharacterized protein n=1 Tax=Arsukibacterium indicum TaxID=2848612 RepID=A0ABS6MQQ5_9GAMM|nr:hypothetical protein [Arsukibacterium indicum]MBV2131123.1 hypothetical protein [Arsukibacterium indicum]
MDDCEFRWQEDDDTGEKWIEFIDLSNWQFWDGYHYYRHLLQIPPSEPPYFMPY